MDDCAFCEMITSKLPAHCIYEDSLFIALLDRESMGRGHCMIIPKQHFSRIYELDDQTYSGLFALAKKISNALKKLYNVKAVAYVASGSGLQHVHLHLIPHNDPDVLMNPSKYIKKLNLPELTNEGEFFRNFLKQNL